MIFMMHALYFINEWSFQYSFFVSILFLFFAKKETKKRRRLPFLMMPLASQAITIKQKMETAPNSSTKK